MAVPGQVNYIHNPAVGAAGGSAGGKGTAAVVVVARSSHTPAQGEHRTPQALEVVQRAASTGSPAAAPVGDVSHGWRLRRTRNSHTRQAHQPADRAMERVHPEVVAERKGLVDQFAGVVNKARAVYTASYSAALMPAYLIIGSPCSRVGRWVYGLLWLPRLHYLLLLRVPLLRVMLHLRLRLMLLRILLGSRTRR
jgi:hypothetical protein